MLAGPAVVAEEPLPSLAKYWAMLFDGRVAQASILAHLRVASGILLRSRTELIGDLSRSARAAGGGCELNLPLANWPRVRTEPAPLRWPASPPSRDDHWRDHLGWLTCSARAGGLVPHSHSAARCISGKNQHCGVFHGSPRAVSQRRDRRTWCRFLPSPGPACLPPCRSLRIRSQPHGRGVA